MVELPCLGRQPPRRFVPYWRHLSCYVTVFPAPTTYRNSDFRYPRIDTTIVRYPAMRTATTRVQRAEPVREVPGRNRPVSSEPPTAVGLLRVATVLLRGRIQQSDFRLLPTPDPPLPDSLNSRTAAVTRGENPGNRALKENGLLRWRSKRIMSSLTQNLRALKKPKWLWLITAIVVVYVVVSLLLSPVVGYIINRRLDRLDGYRGQGFVGKPDRSDRRDVA